MAVARASTTPPWALAAPVPGGMTEDAAIVAAAAIPAKIK